MRPRPRIERSGQAGFVLIGVIIFVLALTIIGLSLYSLSGYEAGFLERSISEQQALQSALGGIERAKFALTVPPFSLQSVKLGLPLENVVAAVAIQSNDSTGTVVWDPGNPILIRVTARVPVGDGVVERRLEASFSPQTVRNYYSQVVTDLHGITIVSQPGASPAQTVNLEGRVWEASGADSTAWWSWLYTPYPLTPIIRDPAATPVDMAFIAAHQVGAPAAPITVDYPAPYTEYMLDAGGGPNVGYFLSPKPDPFTTYSFWSGYNGSSSSEATPVVTVNGLVVWMFPNGVRFNYGVRIRGKGTGNDCLVIVAGPNGKPPSSFEPDPTVGIRLFGGLFAEIPVILVTSGRVVIEHQNNQVGDFSPIPGSPAGKSNAQNGLCIYAGAVTLQGPTQVMSLVRNDPGGNLDQAISQLVPQGALPNVTSASDRSLRFVAGSWRDSLP